jgi:hypothetical protein
MPTPPASSEVVSQTGLLAVEKGTPAARASQTGILAVVGGTPRAAVSQAGILVIISSASVVDPPVPATLDISPTRVSPNQVRTITFILNGGTWASAPGITPSGLAGVAVGAVTLVSPTICTASVTYPPTGGTCTFTESSVSATRNQLVGTLMRWAPHR